MSNEPKPSSDDITLSFTLNSTTHRVLLHLEGDVEKFIQFIQGVSHGIAMAQQQPVTVHSHESSKLDQENQARFEEFLRTIEKTNTADEPGLIKHTPTTKPI